MDKKRIEQLYEILIRGLSLTQEILTMYGYTKEDINELVNENIIKETEPNKWTITNIDNMYKYGISLQLNKLHNKAEKCYRICYQLEPTNRKVCLQLLLFELKRENYIAVQKMFELLEEIEPDKYQEDNNLYLFLLSIILYNNKDYQTRVQNLNPEDILISENKEYESKELQNKIRESILKHKYPYAIKLINDLKRIKIEYKIENELLKELTLKALKLNSVFKSKLATAAKNKDYERIIELLEAKSKNQILGRMEINILQVTKSILEIIKSNKIPPKHNNKTYYLYEAINDNNFEYAKKINLNFLTKINQSIEDDILNILLEDIIERIKYIKQAKDMKAQIEPTKTGKKTVITNPAGINQNVQQQLSKTIFSSSETIKTDTLEEDEELAYYIKEKKQPFKEAIKSLGILPTQILTIKLIYARDYFYEGNYEEGNKLIKEVEESNLTSPKIIELLEEITSFLSKAQKEECVLTRIKNKE